MHPITKALKDICDTWGEPADKPGPSLDSLIENGRAVLQGDPPPNAGREDAEQMMRDIEQDFPAALGVPDAHAFQNFHRSLCARFGYTHDPVDFRRDQVSLEEHIAKLINPERKIVAWCELDGDKWVCYSPETDPSVFENITKHQKKNHYVDVFPLFGDLVKPPPADEDYYTKAYRLARELAEHLEVRPSTDVEIDTAVKVMLAGARGSKSMEKKA